MTNPTSGISAARRAHSARCRQRVIKALNTAVESGEEISVSAIARKAAVDRTFLYRHPDLHALVIAKAAEPPASPTTGPAVSRASLIADLAGAHDRINRLVRESAQLRERLSEALGEQAWRECGLGGPDDIEDLRRRNTELEQQVVELRRQLGEKDDDLDAARMTNRELMALSTAPPECRHPDRRVGLNHTCCPRYRRERQCQTCTYSYHSAHASARTPRESGTYRSSTEQRHVIYKSRFEGRHPS